MSNKNHLLRISVTALMAALCYVAFTYFKVSIPTIGGHTAFHLGNTFCVLASLLLGGVTGGLAGAIGMGIGDVLDPRYVLVAPKTIFLKMMIGVTTGFVAHKLFKIKNLKEKALAKAVFISTACGMFFNVVFEPIFGYFYYQFVINAPEKAAKTLASFNLMTTSTNAILAIIISSLLYLALAPRLQKSGLLPRLMVEKKEK